MRVVTLGTSAGKPTPKRSASSAVLEYEGDLFMFDCGEGTQTQLAKSPFRWGKLKAIFIGHLHGDHVNGLPGLLSSMSMADRTEPLYLFGPRGLMAYLNVLKQIKNVWVRYPLEIKEVNSPGIIFDEEKYRVETAKLDHIIECWGYVFVEKDKPGHFNEEKAKALQIPIGPLRGDLVKGKAITLPSGVVVHPEEILGPKRRGRRVAYCLDTCPCRNDLFLAKDVDLLIHEATFDERMRSETKAWGHSTAGQAAEVAKEANAKQLVLTHISPRYPDPRLLVKEAKNYFQNIDLAWDLSEYEVKSRE